MKLALLFAPDLRRLARQIQEADEELRRIEVANAPSLGALLAARGKLADALESLTGRRPPG